MLSVNGKSSGTPFTDDVCPRMTAERVCSCDGVISYTHVIVEFAVTDTVIVPDVDLQR
jgi:hypothetical protein